MNDRNDMSLTEIERSYPDQWVLVEETVWDEQGQPVRGVVRAHHTNREELSGSLKETHQRGLVKTFFFTGEQIPENLTVAL